MVNVKCSNGVSYGYTFTPENTNNVELAFVGNAGEILKDLAIVANNATFVVNADTGIVTVTPTSIARVDLVAQRAYPHA